MSCRRSRDGRIAKSATWSHVLQRVAALAECETAVARTFLLGAPMATATGVSCSDAPSATSFPKLRPICVRLLRLSVLPPNDPAIPPALAELHACLSTCTTLSPALIHYVFYPLSELLRTHESSLFQTKFVLSSSPYYTNSPVTGGAHGRGSMYVRRIVQSQQQHLEA